MTSPAMMLRDASVADLPEIMRLFDEAVIWLVAHGRSAQWGSEPWSTDWAKTGFVRNMLEQGTTILAVHNGQIVGASVFDSQSIAYAPGVDEPEIYIHLLITSPSVRRHGVGGVLLDAVRAAAIERGVPLLRVDCWAGGDRKLVSYYERAGFTPTVEVPVRDTSVQVFEQRLQLPQP